MPGPVAYTPEGLPIADTELPAAVAKGNARFLKGSQVPFVDPHTGEHYTVPGEQAWGEIQRGKQPISAAEHEHRLAVKAAGESPLEVAKTAGTGLARGLSFGASDVALSQAIPGYSQAEQIRQEANPGVSKGSEIVSYALPIAGELGLGGRVIKAATAAPRALSAGARAVGEAATSGMAKGAAKRVLGGTVTGALEGAAYNAGGQVGQSAVQQDPFDASTAQKVLFAGAEGAGVGGLLGGTLGLLTHMGSKGKAALPAAATPEAVAPIETRQGLFGKAKAYVQGKAAEAEVGTEFRSVGMTGSNVASLGAPEELPRLANRIRVDIGREATDSLTDIAAKAKVAKQTAGKALGSLVDDLDSAGLNVSRNDVTNAFDSRLRAMRESGVPEDAQVARQIERKYLSEFRETTTAPYREREALIRRRAEAIQDEYANGLRQRLEAKNAIETGKTLKPKEIERQVKADTGAFREEFIKRAQGELNAELGPVQPEPVSLKQIRELRQRIDKYERFNFQADTAKDTARKTAIRDIRDAIEKAAVDRMRATAGDEVANSYVQAKLKYRDLAKLEEVIAKRSKSIAGNRALGLSEQLGSAGGIAAGAHAGLRGILTGGILGAVAGHVLKSPTATRISGKLLHAVAGDASKLTDAAIAETATKATTRMQDSLTASVTGSAIRPPKMLQAAAYQVPVAISKGTATVGQLIQHLQSQTAVNDSHAPAMSQIAQHSDMASEVTATQVSAMQLLRDAMPKNSAAFNPMLGKEQPPPSESLMREYASMIHFVDKPEAQLMAEFKSGKLRADHVAAARQLAPQVMDEIGAHVAKTIAAQVESGKTPDYQMRLRAAKLTGLPMDPSDTPEFTAQMQQVYASMIQPPPPPGPAMPRGPKALSAKSRDSLHERTQSISERLSI